MNRLKSLPLLVTLTFCLAPGGALRAQTATNTADVLDRAAQEIAANQHLLDLGRLTETGVTGFEDALLRIFWDGQDPLSVLFPRAARPYLLTFDELRITQQYGEVLDAACGNYYGAHFSVPFGSYDGDQIMALQEVSQSGAPPETEQRTLQAVGGAWSFEPGGMLLKMAELSGVISTPSTNPAAQPDTVTCETLLRFRYISAAGSVTFTPRGNDPLCVWTISGTAEPSACGADPITGGAQYPSSCTTPTLFWSTDGQVELDVSNAAAPVLRYPNGSSETLGNKATNWSVLFPPAPAMPFFAHNQALFRPGLPAGYTVEAYWTTTERADRNGNQTTIQYDPTSQLATAVVDPLGRTTAFGRDASGNVTSITEPAFGGAQPPLTYNLAWQTYTWHPPTTFAASEIPCFAGDQQVTCPDQTFTSLAQMSLPDGRSYQFSYGEWGNLAQVTRPEGGVVAFAYGNANTFSFTPPALLEVDDLGDLISSAHCSVLTPALYKRRLTSTTVYPLGLSGPGYATTTDHKSETQYQSAPIVNGCWKVQEIRNTHPDGTIERTAICEGSAAKGNDVHDGRIFSHEILDASGVREGTYYGNPGTIGDSVSALGQMYMTWEDAGPYPVESFSSHYHLDARPTQVVHVRDGVRWTETFTYDVSTIAANSSQFRTFGNVTAATILDGSGAAVHTNATTYLVSPSYSAVNLIRLPQTEMVQGGAGTTVTRTDFAYDETALVATGAPNLFNVGAARGNLTTRTAYVDVTNVATAAKTKSVFYDTGQVEQVTDPRGSSLTTTRPSGDWALCSAKPTATLLSTNALGQTATLLTDCWSGKPVSQTDVNGQVTRTTYDTLGRALTVTAPGDTSPTRWFEYFLLGAGANTGGQAVTSLAGQRTVVHVKDGSASGRYVKTFTDGLGRTVQVRTKVDPATSGVSAAGAETVVTTNYDDMGRPYQVEVPCFEAAGDSKLDCAAAAATVTAYDALARPVSVTPPGVPPTTTSYGASGLDFVETVTPPNGAAGNITKTTDVLGREVMTSQLWSGCGGCALTTHRTFDAAGRLLSELDPNANQTSYTYDGLGRRLTLIDPDRGGPAGGRWSYAYDGNGNLVSQTDPKGQTITASYDALNRVTLRDLPPAGPGEEDEVFYYDGHLPSACYSCDDHCATTVDTCDLVAMTCTHTGTPCTPACAASISPTTAALPSAGGAGSTAVTDGCAWTAISNAAWITITAPAGGGASGNGTLTFSAAANTAASSRTGTLTVAGLTLTVTQAGVACTASLFPTTALAAAAGSSGNTIAVTSSCSWTAASNATWISITAGASGTGNGTVTYSVAQNSTGASRSGTLTVAGIAFTVTQTSAACSLAASPSSVSVVAAASSGNTIAVSGSCAWSATSTVSWISITGGASGTGSGTVTYSVAQNTASATRTGTIDVGALAVTVTQAGAAAPAGNASLAVNGSTAEYVQVPSAATLNVTGAFTVEAWILATTPATGQQGIVERYKLLTGNDGGFALRLVSGHVALLVVQNGSATASVQGASAVTTGWHHVAGVFDGANLRVYLDGTLDGTASSSLAPAAGTSNLYIGIGAIGPANPFAGEIDEVRLTTSAIYAANFAPAPHLTAIVGATLALWKFDDQTANDSSGHGNNGAFVGGAAPVPDHPEYASLALDGTDGFVKVPAGTSLAINGAITVEAWVKPAAIGTAQQIVAFSPAAGGGYGLRLTPSGTVRMGIDNTATSDFVVGGVVVPAGTWHHVAGVYTGSSMAIYVDGKLDQSKATSTALTSTSSQLRIGEALDGSTIFGGGIDEVRVSAQALYSGTFTPVEHMIALATTRGLWRFDSNFPTDCSGNGNHGTYVGGASASADVP